MKYKVNDIIINKDGGKRKILEVFTQTYTLSYYDHFDGASGPCTEKQLDEEDYTLYQEPKPKIEWGSEESKGEEYWYIDDGGLVFSICWVNNKEDNFRLKTKNVFDTEEECDAKLKEIMES